MSIYYYLNEDKTYRPCSFEEWEQQFEQMRKDETKHLYYDIVKGFMVSTVWLGINLGFGLHDRKPLLFETMVFSKDSMTDEFMWRYSTWEEAEKGHKHAIDLVNEKYAKRISKDDQ